MNTQLIPVPFYNDTLVLADENGTPFVAMRPIVENMGLSWGSQHTKLIEKFESVISIIGTTGADGKRYEMVCLPLRKLANGKARRGVVMMTMPSVSCQQEVLP